MNKFEFDRLYKTDKIMNYLYMCFTCETLTWRVFHLWQKSGIYLEKHLLLERRLSEDDCLPDQYAYYECVSYKHLAFLPSNKTHFQLKLVVASWEADGHAKEYSFKIRAKSE